MTQSALMVVSLMAVLAQAQAQVTTADVQISNISMTEVSSTAYRCDISVFNHHDDDAREVTLHVLLPLEMRVKTAAKGCQLGFAFGKKSGPHGSMLCKLGSMGVGATKSVSITAETLPSAAGYQKSCAAFVWNALPDEDHSNNFKQAIAGATAQ